MRCLVLSSLLLVSLFSQGTFAQQRIDPSKHERIVINDRKYPVFESVKYRSSIDVIGKHLSGILIFKTQEDSSVRAVFVNEMGVTFFDITFYDDSYKFNSIMESMDKKAVKISLAKDLGMILMRGIFSENTKTYGCHNGEWFKIMNCSLDFKLKRKGKVRYHLLPNTPEISLIENYGRKKKVISIQQFYQDINPMPDSIFVQHHNVNFTISLKQLNVTE